MTDNESQDSLSMDGTFFLVNVDPKIKTSAAYENLMQEVLQESQERISTPTEEVIISKTEQNTQFPHYLFEDVYYLGSTVIQKPNDAVEVNRCITDFSKQNRNNCSISLLVPFLNKDSLQMIDPENQSVLASFPIYRIGFCTSGSKLHFGEYLAFSYLQSGSAVNSNKSTSNENNTVLQCHIFKFKSVFYTERILECFRKAFETSSDNSINQMNMFHTLSKTTNVQFKLTIDIKEDDGKGNFVTVSKEDNNVFKFRSNIKKKINIKLEQIDGSLSLHVERCMGLFVGAGRYLNDADMILLEMDSLGEFSNKSDAFVISGEWNPCDKGFELLNNVREKDQQVYMTIGVNFYVQEIHSPLCLKVACKAKIYSEFQRFWLNLKKATILHLMLGLEEVIDLENNFIRVGKYNAKTIQYIWPDGIVTVNYPSNQDGNNGESIDSENEEPVKSGGGIVSKEITDEQLIIRWGTFLNEWQMDINTRPKGLSELVKHGIPEALRGEVWQLMASSLSKESELHDVYRILISKETKYDAVIRRDMPRTFTAHPLFLQKDGQGQQALFHVCKAYASYDEEIGYCQGSAFLAAALILHMPEEQAFSLLVTIMNNYKIRDIFRNNFEGLHICLYQLDHLMAEKLGDLSQHFVELQLESHMYANQWFMTLFTMKFHLYAVFHILDLFLNEGIIIIFKVALSLLKLSRKELLTTDFEGALNYFRITLPKLYRNIDTCKELINTALNIKISNAKLARLEKEWRKIQEVRAETEDPVEILNKELKKTKEEYNRLDQENDALAKELVTSKISLQKNVDKLEQTNKDLDETVEVLTQELFVTRNTLTDILDENHHMRDALEQVKAKFREEVALKEEKLKQQGEIIAEYKKIAKELSERSELSKSCNNLSNGDVIIDHLKLVISKCESCRSKILNNGERPDNIFDDEERNKANEIVCLTKAEYDQQTNQIYETELILANTKLLLVESHCTEQKLTHELNYLKHIVADQKELIETSSNNSIIKKFWSLREKPTTNPMTTSTEHRSDHTSKLEMRHSFCQSDSHDKGSIPIFQSSISQDSI